MRSGATASRLTADCPGAVAVIELCAAEGEPYFTNFVPHSCTTQVPLQLNRIIYGQWRAEDVVAVRTAASRWEIHCHGGRAAVSQILADLGAAGATIIDAADRHNDPAPGSHSQTCERIVANVINLALQTCRTIEAARWVLRQQDGRLAKLRAALSSSDERQKSEAISAVRRWQWFAHHLTSPFRLALVGAPNAGKSSLMNALAGKQRAIVSAVPGTTRDVLEAEIVFNGWTLQIADTAGVRESVSSTLEEFGIQRAIATLSVVDLICLVIDSADPIVDSQLVKLLESVSIPIIVVWNKSDLVPSTESGGSIPSSALAFAGRNVAQLRAAKEIAVSALTGDGVDALLSGAMQQLIPESPPSETPLPLDGVWEDLVPELGADCSSAPGAGT